MLTFRYELHTFSLSSRCSKIQSYVLKLEQTPGKLTRARTVQLNTALQILPTSYGGNLCVEKYLF